MSIICYFIDVLWIEFGSVIDQGDPSNRARCLPQKKPSGKGGDEWFIFSVLLGNSWICHDDESSFLRPALACTACNDKNKSCRVVALI